MNTFINNVIGFLKSVFVKVKISPYINKVILINGEENYELYKTFGGKYNPARKISWQISSPEDFSKEVLQSFLMCQLLENEDLPTYYQYTK